jgi:protein-L-isoaspartate(D-aspartate) O-methyltransferase
VRVVQADGEYGHPTGAPYDAIIVTVEAHDIPPAWTEQLAPDGVLVVPLRMRGNTRSLALTRHGDHLAATSATLCGFVPMQGDGSQPVRRLPLRGDDIVLRLDDTTDLDSDALARAFDQPRLDVWSPVTTPPGVSFESLHLWLASQPCPYGLLATDRDRTADLIDPQNRVACPALISDDSIAYLATRRLDDATWQFGAHGFGPHAGALTAEFLDLIEGWNRHYRHGPGPLVTVYPAGKALPSAKHPRLIVQRRHTSIAVTWFTGGQTP